MGPEPNPEFLGEEEGDVRYKTPQADQVEARLHPTSSHLHPSLPPSAYAEREQSARTVMLRPPTSGASPMTTETTQAALATLERTERSRVAMAKGYAGDPCGECGQFTMVRNGTCLKCDTCGGTTGCS